MHGERQVDEEEDSERRKRKKSTKKSEEGTGEEVYRRESIMAIYCLPQSQNNIVKYCVLQISL